MFKTKYFIISFGNVYGVDPSVWQDRKEQRKSKKVVRKLVKTKD